MSTGPTEYTGKRLPPVLALFALAALTLAPACGRRTSPAKPYEDAARRIRETGLSDEKAFGILSRILGAGPRLTGSAGADRAVDICLGLMRACGFESVHIEPITVNRWVRGGAEAWIMDDEGLESRPLSISALGGSIATPPEGITAELVEVHSLKELAGSGLSASGKIILFNRPMDRKNPDPFSAYGGASDQRMTGASTGAMAGAAAVLVRSLTFRLDDNPHTGMLRYEPGVKQIPAAAVSTLDADHLAELLAAGKKVRVRIRLSCRNEGPAASANVVGQLTGTEHPEEIVLVSGHLDSWDLSPGAHDDGAGCAASIEALRLLKVLGFKPKRTIRAVMFMDEEFGGTGGRFYVDAPERRGERHILAMESDRGAFLPTGLAVGGEDGKLTARIRKLQELFRPLGVGSVVAGGGGVDVGPLVSRGTPGASVITNAQPYFDVHHSALDDLDRVHPRELELQAAIMATLIFIVAQEGLPK